MKTIQYIEITNEDYTDYSTDQYKPPVKFGFINRPLQYGDILKYTKDGWIFIETKGR